MKQAGLPRDFHSNVHEGLTIAPANESFLAAEGAVTRPTGRREYVHVGSTTAVLAADACQSNNRTRFGTDVDFLYRKIR